MKVWLLTSEINDYNQEGEYFEAIFKEKPSKEQLVRDLHLSEVDAVHLLEKGGGRKNAEYHWYHLREEEVQ